MNTPSNLQLMTDEVLKGLDLVCVNIDDVFSRKIEEHVEHLRVVIAHIEVHG